jgi:hypothetical protein
MGENPDKPRRLPIMVMSDNLDVNHIRCRELWGQGAKLKCRATPMKLPNGVVVLNCIQLNSKTLDYESAICHGDECPAAKKGDCNWITKFRFMLPDQSRIGYWEIDTKSANNKGALARELYDTRNMLGGQIAGVDLLLVMTNERTMHPKVTDKGKTSRITINPWLLHIELGKSLRKLMAEANVIVRPRVVDTSLIEDSFDQEEAPIDDGSDNGEFEVGTEPAQQPETQPEASAQPEQPSDVVDAEFTADHQSRSGEVQTQANVDEAALKSEKLDACKQLCVALGLSNVEINMLADEHYLPKPKDMTLDQAQTFYDALYAKLDAKSTTVDADYDPFDS